MRIPLSRLDSILLQKRDPGPPTVFPSSENSRQTCGSVRYFAWLLDFSVPDSRSLFLEISRPHSAEYRLSPGLPSSIGRRLYKSLLRTGSHKKRKEKTKKTPFSDIDCRDYSAKVQQQQQLFRSEKNIYAGRSCSKQPIESSDRLLLSHRSCQLLPRCYHPTIPIYS